MTSKNQVNRSLGSEEFSNLMAMHACRAVNVKKGFCIVDPNTKDGRSTIVETVDSADIEDCAGMLCVRSGGCRD